jgi:hypothetical protein
VGAVPCGAELKVHGGWQQPLCPVTIQRGYPRVLTTYSIKNSTKLTVIGITQFMIVLDRSGSNLHCKGAIDLRYTQHRMSGASHTHTTLCLLVGAVPCWAQLKVNRRRQQPLCPVAIQRGYPRVLAACNTNRQLVHISVLQCRMILDYQIQALLLCLYRGPPAICGQQAMNSNRWQPHCLGIGQSVTMECCSPAVSSLTTITKQAPTTKLTAFKTKYPTAATHTAHDVCCGALPKQGEWILSQSENSGTSVCVSRQGRNPSSPLIQIRIPMFSELH